MKYDFDDRDLGMILLGMMGLLLSVFIIVYRPDLWSSWLNVLITIVAIIGTIVRGKEKKKEGEE